MKATSKLISVVLILAMCLSLFTVSAFAAGPSVIIMPMEGDELDASQGTTYDFGADAGMTVSSTENTADSGSVPTTTVPAVVDVHNAAELAAAAVNGGEIRLADSIVMNAPLVFNTKTVLNLNGKALRFENANGAQGTAITGNGAVAVQNGAVTVSGGTVPTQSGKMNTGFQSVASGVTFNNVNVSFNAPAEWAIFGSGVGLVYGSYNRDVSAWVGSQFELAESNGVFVIRDKTVAPETPVETVTEPVSTEGEQATAEGEVTAEGQQAEVEQTVTEGEEAGAEGEGEEAGAEGEGEEAGAEDEGEEAGAEGEGEEAGAEGEGEEAGAEGEGEVLPASDEEQNEENPTDEPADETPVNIVEEEEPVYVDEVRVTEEEEASEEGLVTLTGMDEVTGAVVIVTGKNLPEGLTVVVKAASNDSLGELKEGEEAILVLDISLVDAEGNEYEPKDDPNVGAVSVQIKHPSLGNLEEDEALALYHVVDDVAQNVGSATQTAEDTLEFATGSFSLYGVVKKPGDDGSTRSGGEGEVHKKVITIKSISGDIYVKQTGGTFTFEVYGGSAPESVSIVDADSVNSGNINVFRAGYLAYGDEYTIDPKPDETNQTTDPFKVIIKNDAVVNATAGKYAVVFWFKDTDDNGDVTRVYLVQYITIVPKAEIKALLPEDEWGDYYFNKCSYDPMEFYLTAELDELFVSDSSGNVVIYQYGGDKKKVAVTDLHGNTKVYNFNEMLSVSDYTAYDPVTHEFIGGKTLKLLPNLFRKLNFGDYKITIHQKNHNPTTDKPENEKTETFTVSLRPGITVADGLNDYIKGKNVWIKFEACWPIDYDENGKLMIYIGGQQISKDYYSISNDHQTLWIYRNLLDQLRSNNSYTLTAQLWRLSPKDGTKETYYPASTSFNILAAGSTSYKSPKTGDNSNVALWAAVAVLSGGAVVALIPKKKKVKIGK